MVKHALISLLVISWSTRPVDRTPSFRQSAQSAQFLLSARCLSCHDSVKRTGGVDLSTRSTALGVLSPNRPELSKLVRMVTSGKMPPTGKLADQDVKVLLAWVRVGSPYPNEPLKAINPAMLPLWSFQPVRRPPIPHSKFDHLSGNPIDRFVFKPLEEKGLAPTPPAARLALLRRVSVDLTGLPPPPVEIASFIDDRSPNAYEKVVDRLLASPGYGERWGRHWLDVVRYGESNGYEQNHLRGNAWPYRDYVIRSFNEDKPYNRFIQEQLAGDVIGKGDPNTEVGTGFLVAGVHDTVGIQEDEGTRQQRSNDLEDMVSTTSAAFLGLTVGCAKCHDHKFDPIPQRDFYRMAAVFAGVRHGERAFRQQTDAERNERKELERQVSSPVDAINEIDRQAREIVLKSRGVTPAARPSVNARRNVDTFPATSARFIRFTILATKDNTEPCLDELQIFGPGSDLNVGSASSGAKATASSALPGFEIHQVEHLNDGLFGNDHSWISATKGTGWAQIDLLNEKTIDRVVWSRDGGENPRFDDRLPIAYKIEVSKDGVDWTTVSSDKGRAGSSEYVHPDELEKALNPEQKAAKSELKKKLDLLRAQTGAMDARTMAYIGHFSEPDQIYVLKRGDVMQRMDEVQPGALSRIEALPSDLIKKSAGKPGGVRLAAASADTMESKESDRRIALANWLTDPRNPLTARVIVNRVWQHHFGRGIVGTPSDFGRNGEKPTHPALLDWMAAELMNGFGWRLKPLHRLIITSYTYRQASAANSKGVAVDAGNSLLWRMPLQRMEGEALRDAILQTSGKLNRAMGGPSYQLFKYRVVNVSIYEAKDEFGPETWRRSVYHQPARAIRDDLLGTFDCPESSQRAPRRDNTTTALQALSLLNGPFALQQAGFFADRVRAKSAYDLNAQVRHAFMLAYGRLPNAAEGAAAVKLAAANGIGDLCRALMNGNEFLYY